MIKKRAATDRMGLSYSKHGSTNLFPDTNWPYQWQYNGAGALQDILDWGTWNLPDGEWCFNGWETVYFKTGRAYAWFLLRWS
jgi:hypothetical protein